MLLNVAYPLPPKRHSVRASLVMDHFGINHDVEERVLARDLDVPVQPGDVVLFTGGSGSGKSSLLRALVKQIEGAGDKYQVTSDKEENLSSIAPCHLPLVTSLLHLDLGTQILVDALPLEFEESLQLLATCGLGEAPLMLRTPQELSDGQRYRFALALAIARKPQWIVADEFAALLDRTTAKVIAHNVRRLADRYGIGFVLATAQNDIETDLEPDLCVTCELDGQIDVRVARVEPTTLPITNASPSGSSKKKSGHQLPRRTLDQHRHPLRLAVFRSVALPQPPHRADEVRRAAVAQRPADRGLHLRRPAAFAASAQPVLWASGGLESSDAARPQPAARHAATGRDSPGLSRGGPRLRICATGVRALPVFVDRDDEPDGADSSLL